MVNSASAKRNPETTNAEINVRFIYPGDHNLRNLGIENHALKFWSNSEQDRVKTQLKNLTPRISKFLHLNANQSIQLGLVKGLIQGNKVALTTPNAILLSDDYFTAAAPQANKTLLHELTHYSDCARYFSWSKQWIDFCETKKIAQDWSGINPYAEALAEFVSETLTTENPQADDVSFIERLFSDSGRYQEWAQHMRTGLELKAIRNFKGAIPEFEKASQIDQSSLMPHLQLVYCYYHLSSTDKALYESELAMRIIHKLELKLCAVELAEFLARRYGWLLEKKSELEAETFYSEITQKCREKIPSFKKIKNRAKCAKNGDSTIENE